MQGRCLEDPVEHRPALLTGLCGCAVLVQEFAIDVQMVRPFYAVEFDGNRGEHGRVSQVDESAHIEIWRNVKYSVLTVLEAEQQKVAVQGASRS